MDEQRLIQRFTELVNSGQPAYDLMSAEGLSGELLDDLRDMYDAASRPGVFYQQPLTVFDERIEQVYELLRLTFDHDVLESREVYRRGFRDQSAGEHGGIVWGRFFRVLGSHQYTPAGQLERFGFDRLTVTEGIVGTIMGSCIPMNDRDMVAGLGYLAVREGFQRLYGHGSLLLQAFEQQALDLASRQGRRLLLIMLESENGAAPYWFKRGYRWPNGSRYSQPALHRDPSTGAALTPPAPKRFMVKCPDDPEAASIDPALLLVGLRALYDEWYIPDDDAPPKASQRIRAEVFDNLFAEFEQSLMVENRRVALLYPPSDELMDG